MHWQELQFFGLRFVLFFGAFFCKKCKRSQNAIKNASVLCFFFAEMQGQQT
jgi:hypothetical protein